MIGGTRFRIATDSARQAVLTARIARGQADIATGTRLQAASDDPAASARVAQLAQARASTAAWAANAATGAAHAALTDGVLGSVQANLDRARELVTLAANATASASDRATYADELRSLADDVDVLAATRTAEGAALFDADAAPQPSVGDGEQVAAGLSRAQAFGSGAQALATVLRAAATAMTGSGSDRDAALADVVAAGDRVAGAAAVVGIRAARLDAIATRLTDREAKLAEAQGTIADTDVPATVARIQADQLSLDASRSLFARVNRQTLFDLLG